MSKAKNAPNGKNGDKVNFGCQDREENLGARKDQGIRELLRRYIALRASPKSQYAAW